MSADSVYSSWETNQFNNRWVLRLSGWGCRLLPQRTLYALSDSIMEWFQGYRPSTAAAVADNLAKAFPEKSRKQIEALAGGTFQSYGRGVVDYLHAGNGSEVVPRGAALDIMESLVGGAILVTAHMGNWEVGGEFLGKAIGPHMMVGFPERDEGVEDFRRIKRETSGHTTLFVGMGVSGMLRLRRGLESGQRMVVLADRALGKDAVEVTFRGRPANFLKSPSVFSLMTGVPLVPVAVMCDGPGAYSAFVGEPYTTAACGGSPGAAMQRSADFFSDILERYPDQWYNFFRYWREDL
jgi:KDO2-lipid IV(A) lauroyltransferase